MIYLMISLNKHFYVLFFIYYIGDIMSVDISDVNGIIIDIRSSIEYNEYHYPGSINIPRIILLTDPNRFLDFNKTYYLICERGHESISTTRVLNALGYNCYSINGGIKALLN